MKSYLSLIPISARVHKRRSRLTLLCIIFAVFMVTTIFGIADMSVRMEKTRMLEKHGNWHIGIQNIADETSMQLKHRSDVEVSSWYDVINEDMNEEYYVCGKKAVLCGAEEAYVTKMWNGLKEGKFPQQDNEILLSINARDTLGVKMGDRVTVKTPAGEFEYIVSGFGGTDSSLDNQNYVVNVFLNQKSFQILCEKNGLNQQEPFLYLQFKTNTNVNKSIADIEETFSIESQDITENNGLLAITGASGSSTMQNLYLFASVLFVMILIAGVLMIAGSINSNVAQRTKFYGMLRCVGASQKQIKRMVRLEALNWCKVAVPVGVVLGTIITWLLCVVLRFGIGGEFAEMPLFQVSGIGIISGVTVGIVTVLLAAQSPAKRASRVSPVAAVSGHTQDGRKERNAANTKHFKIETSLGVHHAVATKKNFILMISSFALSIILFLVFCTGLDLAHALLPSLREWQPDCTINGYENASTVSKELVTQLQSMPAVETVSGCEYDGKSVLTSDHYNGEINLITYDEYMLNCAKKSIVSGTLSEIKDGCNGVLTIYNKENPLQVGDEISINGTTLQVDGALSDGMFTDGITIICTEDTFARLVGDQNYSMMLIKFNKDVTDKDISAISELAGKNNIFSDLRESNKQINSTYWAFRVFAYSFLGIIALITVLNIINSTSMSVSAKMKQYGAMRAVGMDCGQLVKMITSEVLTYALTGSLIGSVLGLFFNKLLYDKIITAHLGMVWSMPIKELIVILVLVITAVAAAIYTPAKRIQNMAVTETINEL